MNLFNISKEGQDIATNIKVNEMVKITGINAHNTTRYIGKEFNGFMITYANQQEVDKAKQFPPKLLREWDKMKKAADLIREGKGVIVTKRQGKKIIKYVEVKK